MSEKWEKVNHASDLAAFESQFAGDSRVSELELRFRATESHEQRMASQRCGDIDRAQSRYAVALSDAEEANEDLVGRIRHLTEAYKAAFELQSLGALAEEESTLTALQEEIISLQRQVISQSSAHKVEE